MIATSQAATSQGARSQDDSVNALLDRLPSELRERLPPEFAAALTRAAAPRRWKDHPIDIRISIPLPFRRFYITLVAGPERRSSARRALDRRSRQIASLGNVLFVLLFVGVFYAAIIGAARRPLGSAESAPWRSCRGPVR
jgi:hypothetical protein